MRSLFFIGLPGVATTGLVLAQVVDPATAQQIVAIIVGIVP